MPTLLEAGDAIRGDRVLINARRLSDPQIINQSGRHKANAITARDNLYCVIDMPLRARPRDHQSG